MYGMTRGSYPPFFNIAPFAFSKGAERNVDGHNNGFFLDLSTNKTRLSF